MRKRGWRGYIFSRTIGGQMIPQRVQNLVLRVYAEKNSLLYLLSATEYHIPGSYMMLESLYPDLTKLEGILFYSLNMLPEDRARRLRLYDAVLKIRCGLHFALEELSLEKASDIAMLEDVFTARQLSRQADLSILARS